MACLSVVESRAACLLSLSRAPKCSRLNVAMRSLTAPANQLRHRLRKPQNGSLPQRAACTPQAHHRHMPPLLLALSAYFSVPGRSDRRNRTAAATSLDLGPRRQLQHLARTFRQSLIFFDLSYPFSLTPPDIQTLHTRPLSLVSPCVNFELPYDRHRLLPPFNR